MSFDRSLTAVLKSEGGYVNHPNDPGGATNMGITQRVYDDWRRTQRQPLRSVKEIEVEEVRSIYQERYWAPTVGELDLEWPMSLLVFDAAVNHGIHRALKFLAEAPFNPEHYLEVRERFYRDLVARRPASGVFLKGWLNRLDHLREVIAV